MSVLIEDGALVLFQGDSITDGGRDRENGQDIGRGYAMIASATFSAMYPAKRVRFLNRGIGGNRVRHLVARWQEDCIDIKPDWLSIMIGINDTWHGFKNGQTTPHDSFEADYRAILTRARDEVGPKLILMEPFVLPTPADRAEWRADLDPRIHTVRTLAREFDAICVPLDGLFAASATQREPEFWAEDGVHPSPAGHALIARAWLQAVGAI